MLIISRYFIVIIIFCVFSFSNYLKIFYFKTMIGQKQHFCLVHEMWVGFEHVLVNSGPHIRNYTKYIIVINIFIYMYSRLLNKNR